MWGFRKPKLERVGVYEGAVYNVSNMNLAIRRRTEHLTKKDVQQLNVRSFVMFCLA